MKLSGIFFNAFAYRPTPSRDGRRGDQFQALLHDKTGAAQNPRHVTLKNPQQELQTTSHVINRNTKARQSDSALQRMHARTRWYSQEHRIQETLSRRTVETVKPLDTLARWRPWLTRQQLDALSANPSNTVVWECDGWRFSLKRNQTGFSLEVVTPDGHEASNKETQGLRQRLEQTLSLPVAVTFKH